MYIIPFGIYAIYEQDMIAVSLISFAHLTKLFKQYPIRKETGLFRLRMCNRINYKNNTSKREITKQLISSKVTMAITKSFRK